MTSSDSWNCDGIPKNGREYSGLGGQHPDHQNYSLDCEICGLPKESQTPGKTGAKTGSLPSIVKTLAGIAVAGVVVIAGGTFIYQSLNRGCEIGLEKVAGECIDPFLQTYEDATQKGDEAVNLADNYQSISDLETAQSDLSNAVTDLSQIPSEALVYSQVEPKLEAYKVKKTEIAADLDRETAAKEQLDEIILLAQNAKELTEAASTEAELTAAKQKWDEVNQKLETINGTALISDRISQYQTDYEGKIENIDEQMATLAEQNRPTPTSTVSTPSNTYKPPRKTYTPPRQPQKSTPRVVSPKPKAIPRDPCAGNNPPPNCIF